MYDFGARLRELREAKKLTQTQVAKRLNLHKSSIYGYENNIRIPSVEVLSQLALFYRVTTDYLLGHDNRHIIYVDGLTERQLEVINLLLLEFKQGKGRA